LCRCGELEEHHNNNLLCEMAVKARAHRENAIRYAHPYSGIFLTANKGKGLRTKIAQFAEFMLVMPDSPRSLPTKAFWNCILRPGTSIPSKRDFGSPIQSK
jgi:hypothetical protein